MFRPLFPNVLTAGLAKAEVLKYAAINSCRDRPGSRNGLPTSMARWLPSPGDPPSAAVSAPVVIENGGPELMFMLPDNCQPPAIRASSFLLPRPGRFHTPLRLRIDLRSKAES